MIAHMQLTFISIDLISVLHDSMVSKKTIHSPQLVVSDVQTKAISKDDVGTDDERISKGSYMAMVQLQLYLHD